VPDTPEAPGLPGQAAALRAGNGRLREANEHLRMLLEDKDAQIAELKARNAELAERVARLERLISHNSGNSSMPPSTDELPGEKPPERRPRRGGRRPGKQPGAPGTCLAWREYPDKTEDVFAEGSCGCGADLADAADPSGDDLWYAKAVDTGPADCPGRARVRRRGSSAACGRRAAGPQSAAWPTRSM